MLKRILTITCLLITLTAGCLNAQSLSLDNLLAMQQGGPGAINRILLPRGWVFTGHDDNIVSRCDFQSVSWAYSLSSQSDKAAAFLNLVKDRECQYAIGYQTGRLETYNAIMATIARYGMVQTDSDVETSAAGESSVVEYYTGKNYTVKVSVSSGENDMGELRNSYVFAVFLKSE